MQSTQQAIFWLGEEEYGLDIMDVNIIEKVTTIEPIVNFPKNLKGIIRLRGEVIPVYSLRRKLGMTDKETNDDTRFIITTSNDIPVAYEIDKMKEIVQIEPEQIFEVPAILKSKDTSYMKSIMNNDERLIVILNHDGILTEEEQSKIETVVKK